MAAEGLRDLLPCFLVNNLTSNAEEQCKFIIDNDCLEDESRIDYMRLVFCDFGCDNKWAAILLVLFLVIILFLNLSAVADEFLCPNLLTVAKNLRMSDSLAGVTLLAFGNGCPDIFSSLAAAASGRPEMIVGELLGAGIFCTSIVAGLVFIHSDFKLARRPLLRDAAFYLLAVFLMWLFCYEGVISFYGSLAFIIIYVIYLLFALIGQAIHARMRGEYLLAWEVSRQDEKSAELAQQEEIDNWFQWREESLRRGSLIKRAECCASNEKKTLVLSDDLATMKISYLTQAERPAHRANDKGRVGAKLVPVEKCCWCTEMSKSGRPGAENSFKCQTSKQTMSSIVPMEPSSGPDVILEASEGRRLTLDEVLDFWSQINPIKRADWQEASLLGKTILVLRAPLFLVALLTIPVVDKEKRDFNWNRLLNSIQCVTIPIAVIVLLRLGSESNETTAKHLVDGSLASIPTTSQQEALLGWSARDWTSFIPVRFLLVSPTIGLALFVFASTSAHQAPKLQAIYSYFGFAMSVMWIYVLATEIVSILKTVGILFSMSDTAIGLGVLAWGNSLGDIVANLTLAEAGHARMALGASIGAPLLNLLLGFGLAFCLSLKPGESVEVEYTHTTALLAVTLALVLILLMLSTLATGSSSKKPFGYLLISCYGIYFALAVCLECDLIRL